MFKYFVMFWENDTFSRNRGHYESCVVTANGDADAREQAERIAHEKGRRVLGVSIETNNP